MNIKCGTLVVGSSVDKFPKLMLNGRLKSILTSSRKWSGNDEAKIIPFHAIVNLQNSTISNESHKNSSHKKCVSVSPT